MIGGTGNDTFQIANANVTKNAVWDNIANFHHGDSISLAGMAGAGWTYSWTDAYGTSANPALTLVATSTANIGLTEMVTINGLSLSDVSSLTIAKGSGPSAGTLTISM